MKLSRRRRRKSSKDFSVTNLEFQIICIKSNTYSSSTCSPHALQKEELLKGRNFLFIFWKNWNRDEKSSEINWYLMNAFFTWCILQARIYKFIRFRLNHKPWFWHKQLPRVINECLAIVSLTLSHLIQIFTKP